MLHGLSVGLRIVEGHVQLHMAEIRPVEALRDTQVLAVRMSGEIEPGLVVETGGDDHEGVAFPVTH